MSEVGECNQGGPSDGAKAVGREHNLALRRNGWILTVVCSREDERSNPGIKQMASRRWKVEGSPGWTARSPCRRAFPEVYITGAFEKDPTVTGNLGTTPLSLTSILTTRPEHMQ